MPSPFLVMVFSFSFQAVRRQLLTPKWASSLDHGFQHTSSFRHPASVMRATQNDCVSSSGTFVRRYTAATANEPPALQKRKNLRSPAVQRSLRRVAVEAERSSGKNLRQQDGATDANMSLKSVTAICVAEEFAMDSVVRILRSQGYPIDPYGTGFLDDQVVHTRAVSRTSCLEDKAETVLGRLLVEMCSSSHLGP